ncbi:hypothetical protein A2957_00230 [Candidatus Roizmanbacteria bacterium RIFCSPLOWO2_01_FULL_38_11]|uniref:Leucine--tRNA ligase n=2 Tax=Candidatus Roizmaniibacteriota TaxID=1752723 RepID=A0A1F7ILU5_9BACT|nr:MAG: hypothetical protein A2957_00230 [Candidatus Roizmanbacteria bacterium RIFCSPLOWO2_01_FULL_38_11]
MKNDIPFSEIEKKMSLKWDVERVYKTSSDKKKEKMYTLVMFPYPSGAGLHTGHARIYTGTDVLARFYRMNGKAVLHPMGWDAFGLPTENSAIKQKRNPMEVTTESIANFKRQMKMLGLSYDWDKEIDTTDPEYYAVTQWLFIQFFKYGLLYKKETPVYYCDSCKTGLAQEEVLQDGTHERCGNVVQKRSLPQWSFRITEYADSLLEGLNELDWPKGIIEMQKNWIGKKQGINITYSIVGENNEKTEESVTCFTTRPDTNFGATFIVISPEHSLVKKLLERELKTSNEAQSKSIQDYVNSALAKTERERLIEGKKKTGVFTGYYAVNHLNDRQMPIWISDFVLANVGTGAVVGVPGHDVRDFEFAQAFGIDIQRVVVTSDGDSSPITRKEQVQEEEGTMINSGFLDGMNIHDATRSIMDHMEKKGWGKRVISYHLRDWIFSRQRYWGEPIPMIFCQNCEKNGISFWDTEKGKNMIVGLSSNPNNARFEHLISSASKGLGGWFPMEERALPHKLPPLDSYEPGQDGLSPLAKAKDWVETKCPHCGSDARRETDTMPNWAGSCWYFLAFAMDPVPGSAKGNYNASTVEKSIKDASAYLPVDWYIVGAEHAVLHLLYARFWIHVLYDLGFVTVKEPFRSLENIGIVIAEDGRKMSKSWGNVINPDDVVKRYGTDVLRVYEMFMAPFDQEVVWSTQTLQGSYRFLRRIWHKYSLIANSAKDIKKEDKELVSELQKLIYKISKEIPDVKFNTCISSFMEFFNLWDNSETGLSKDNAKIFLKLLSPFAPYFTDYVWSEMYHEVESIHISDWPKADDRLIIRTSIQIPVQVNGKVRGLIEIASNDEPEESIIKKALAEQSIQKWIGNSKYKAIYIKGNILNFVIIG